MVINTVFTHLDFYVVNKPAGVGFHDEGDLGSGFFNQCCKHFGEILYPVHRLDKITSGLLILARNKNAADWFQKAFSTHIISKFYIAISGNKPKKKQGSVIGDMEKSRRSQWRLLNSKVNPAITRFFSYSIASDIPGLRLFLVKPESGKTHQIRVALKCLSSAILGDELYGGQQSDRGYLHAVRLDFDYKNESISVVCMPQEGKYFISEIKDIQQVVESALTNNWPGTKLRAND